jgi:hypothetical protein
MRKVEITLSDPLYYRIEKISDILEIDFNEIAQLCLVDGGYYRYWLHIDNILEDAANIVETEGSTDTMYNIKEELRQQLLDRIEIIKDIELVEDDFRKRVRKPTSDIQQHRAFLDFIDSLHSENIILSKYSQEPEKPAPIIEEQVKKQRAIEQVQEAKVIQTLSLKLLSKKYVPMPLFSCDCRLFSDQNHAAFLVRIYLLYHFTIPPS